MQLIFICWFYILQLCWIWLSVLTGFLWWGGESLRFWGISIVAALFFFFFHFLWQNHLQTKHILLIFWCECLFFLVLIKLLWLGLLVLCYIEVVWMRIIALLLILEGNNTHWGKYSFFNKWKSWLSAYRKK